MSFDDTIIHAHKQKYIFSCIPSAVEMILKLLRKVPVNYYDLQDAWQNKCDGNFNDFDGKVVEGVKFHQKFNTRDHPRGPSFPLEGLSLLLMRRFRQIG